VLTLLTTIALACCARTDARLEQIVALKFIGFSLKDIKMILMDRKNTEVGEMLRLQREIITRKRGCLDSASASY
jgi:DNA-binding transcriptional MerR regulator